ncbi:amidohydrolase [Luteitalea sp. TBR-22]|uniref:amidohydrolase family protein n=1 Tax=Luteitalea sp. TBR-22 TaxID=2802971 RepID=UPI001AF85C8B|nr:amidohydrolase family protein [Luteitalea sp. TBR-22]BCS30926.1 amidohydrolase [Luteitalea sp. TBR-22]
MRHGIAATLAAVVALGLAVRGQSPALALVGVDVIPMDRERVLQRQTLVIRDGRIVEMGPTATVKPPAGARIVNGAGKYVLPALGEMHGHLAGPNTALNERILALNVVHGVLTVRSMLGHPAQLTLRDRVARGEVLGPRIYTSGPSANGQSVTTAAAGEQMARDQKAAGYDLIKIHPGVPLAAFEALARTARQVGIPIAGHVPADVGVHRAIAAGYRTIEHLDGYAEAALRDGVTMPASGSGFFGSSIAPHLDDRKIPALVQETKAAGVWLVPTETLMVNFLSDEPVTAMMKRPELAYITADMRQQWENGLKAFRGGPQNPNAQDRARLMAFRSRLLRQMQDAGVGILLGADSPQILNVPGIATHQELVAVVKAGLTPYEALASGTRNVAVYLGTDTDGGTVAPGMRANLLVVNANPLQDVSRTQDRFGVVHEGTWHDRAALDDMLAALRVAP